jgi:adenylate cyclase
MVKSLGDGMLLEFEAVPQAVVAALAARSQRHTSSSAEHLPLRMGIHWTDVVVDDFDVFGSGVNLAARLATLGQPGDLVASVDVRDHLIAGVDAEIEDLGDCYLKHLDQPVRAFRLAPSGQPPQSTSEPRETNSNDLRPTIVVMPLRAISAPAAEAMLGDIVADDLIGAFARSEQWNVVSRLSATVAQGRKMTMEHLRGMLHASHVLSGHFRCHGSHARLTLELAECAVLSHRRTLWRGHGDSRSHCQLRECRRIGQEHGARGTTGTAQS